MPISPPDYSLSDAATPPGRVDRRVQEFRARVLETAEDLFAERGIEAHPEQRDALLSPYTLVRKQGAALIDVPYAERFAADLTPAVTALREAAAVVDHPGFAQFVTTRAAALAGEAGHKLV